MHSVPYLQLVVAKPMNTINMRQNGTMMAALFFLVHMKNGSVIQSLVLPCIQKVICKCRKCSRPEWGFSIYHYLLICSSAIFCYSAIALFCLEPPASKIGSFSRSAVYGSPESSMMLPERNGNP